MISGVVRKQRKGISKALCKFKECWAPRFQRVECLYDGGWQWVEEESAQRKIIRGIDCQAKEFKKVGK